MKSQPGKKLLISRLMEDYHTIIKDGKYFKLEKATRKNGLVIDAYVEINKNEYEQELKAIAQKVIDNTNSRELLLEIIIDALYDKSHNEVVQFSKALDIEIKEAKAAKAQPEIKTVVNRGGCVSLTIGKTNKKSQRLFSIRESQQYI